MTNRKGEKDEIYFHSDRLFCINGNWFFNVRESLEPMGPFSDRKTASREIERYLRDLETNTNPALTHRMYENIYKR